MKKVAYVDVLEPVEIRRASKELGSQDILDKKFFKQLLTDAGQHSNGGTRRKHCLEGLNCLQREIKGNLILKRTLKLIAVLTKAGNWWTLENPKSSYVWLMPELKKWISQHTTYEATMH